MPAFSTNGKNKNRKHMSNCDKSHVNTFSANLVK